MTHALSAFTTARYRQLLWEFIKRELSQRYQQSLLGYLWVIVQPLIQMLVMSFIFSQILRADTVGAPFPIFLLVGFLPWTLFSNSWSAATNSLVDNANLLAKIYFPREILLLAAIGGKIVDFCFASLIFIVLMIVYQITPTWNLLWLIPIFFLQNIFVYGLSLLTSSLNLFYRDVQYLLNLFLMLLMFLTPIFYAPTMLAPRARFFLQFNPLAILINAYRTVTLAGQAPDFSSLGLFLGLAIVLILGGFWLFKKLEGQFADAV